MRRIGTLDDQARARTLSDVLYARGMDNDVRDDDDGFAVWVHDDAQLDAARAVLAEVRDASEMSAFQDEVAAARSRRKTVAAKDQAYRERIALAQRTMHGAQGRGRVTLALLVLSGLVALVSGLGSNWSVISFLFLTLQPPAAMLPEVQAGQVWRLVTPIVVHFGIVHLAFNGWMWWSFAQAIEARKGARFFAVFVLVAAVASNLAEFGWQFVSSPYRPALVGGLSGVLYAVFGYAWLKGRLDPLDRIGVSDQTSVILVGWLLLCMTGLMGSIANGAHLGGLVFGLVWAWLDVQWFRLQKQRLRDRS